MDRDDRARPAPRPGDVPLDEDGARPDAGCPEGGALFRIGDEQLAVRALEQIEEIATRKQSCRGGRPVGRPKQRLVGGEDDRVADRGMQRDERRAERVEGGERRARAEAGPGGEAPGRAGTEGVEVAARQLDAGVERIDLGTRHGPDDRLARAAPADQHSAGQRRIAEGVGVDAEGLARLGRIEPAAVEVGVELRREVLGPASGAAGIR